MFLAPFAQLAAQETGRTYTDADYAQAEKFMPYNVAPLVLHAVNDPVWLADGRAWYSDAGAHGHTYFLIDPVRATKAPAFRPDKAGRGAAGFESIPRPARSRPPAHSRLEIREG